MSKKNKGSQDQQVIARNRRARRDYDVEETYETGIVLVGTEVKSLRDGRISLNDAYAEVLDNELWLKNVHIHEYMPANQFNHDPVRPRKLLMHRREIRNLAVKSRQQGYTLIPLSLYFNENRVKVELALCHGKKQYDHRQAIAARDAQREIARALRRRQ